MPLKAGEEQADITEALQKMAARVGDGQFDDPLFESTDGEFSGILQTTWELLEEKCWIEQLRNNEYRLKARGWIEALRATGALCDSAMKDSLGKVCARIKARCVTGTGRHRAGATVHEVAAETGLSEAYIYNVVDAHLIRECFGQVDCEWEPGDEQMKTNIMIPARFGKSLSE
jgi:hypothetical protein